MFAAFLIICLPEHMQEWGVVEAAVQVPGSTGTHHRFTSHSGFSEGAALLAVAKGAHGVAKHEAYAGMMAACRTCLWVLAAHEAAAVGGGC
jgi:hypothetical protein